jgi:hypothetical protein
MYQFFCKITRKRLLGGAAVLGCLLALVSTVAWICNFGLVLSIRSIPASSPTIQLKRAPSMLGSVVGVMRIDGVGSVYLRDARESGYLFGLIGSEDYPKTPHSARGSLIYVSDWEIAFLSLLLTLAVYVRSLRLNRSAPGKCPTCDYDLRAHQPGQKCPECGTPISRTVSPATCPQKTDTSSPP